MTQAHRSTAHGGKAPGGSRSGGFTLIEVITVLLIVGILASVVLSSGTTLNSDLSARVGEVRSQLRYVQLMAMKNSLNSLALTCDGTFYWAHNSTNASLSLPGESSATISLADKKMQMTPFTIAYDAFGIPYSGNPLAKLTNNATISITVGGKTGTLTVTPETGFVP